MGRVRAQQVKARSRQVVSARTPTWSKRVANRLQEVRIPPLGPRLYCFMTCL